MGGAEVEAGVGESNDAVWSAAVVDARGEKEEAKTHFISSVGGHEGRAGNCRRRGEGGDDVGVCGTFGNQEREMESDIGAMGENFLNELYQAVDRMSLALRKVMKVFHQLLQNWYIWFSCFSLDRKFTKESQRQAEEGWDGSNEGQGTQNRMAAGYGRLATLFVTEIGPTPTITRQRKEKNPLSKTVEACILPKAGEQRCSERCFRQNDMSSLETSTTC